MKGFVRKIRDKLAPDRMVGREFDGFRIEEKIAKGGMSTIYRAAGAGMSKAAVKILDEEFCRSQNSASHFIFEAELIESISHPGIVKGISHGAIDGSRLYTVMEYLEGTDAGSLIRGSGPIEPEKALAIALQACRGLAEVHGRRVMHRDVKPDNMMVGPGGLVKLLDLGIAKALSAGSEDTWDGKIYGTIYFVAPEQTIGNRYDERADIYSAGVSLYRMLTGSHPFESDDMRKLIFLIQNMTPRPPSDAGPGRGISPGVDGLVMKALSKKPSERFQSAAEMAGAVECCLGAK
ncbi:MAG TPA: serine/threonine-protein kinase [Candidatus Bilamarchaeum sp.]|nr:serine/threonine-protein kinase [Candidatus Bilamarchaeum sp.]